MRYAIFDLDGTLIDSMTHWRNVTREFVKSLNLDLEQEMKRILTVNWREEIAQIVRDKYNIEITVKQMDDWVCKYMVGKYSTEIELKPYAREMLDTFLSQGVKMCICSSTDYSYMKPALERLDMLKYFDFTVHCREFGSEKDSKEIFYHCMERLGAENPSQVAVFEDAVYSARTAKANGFYVVTIDDVNEHNKEEIKRVSDQYLQDYSQLNYELLPV